MVPTSPFVPFSAVFPDPLPRILKTPSMNLLAGASGVGKTSFLAWMANSLRTGTPIFGTTPEIPPAIGYIGADRPWADASLWFEAVGFGEIAHYSIVDDHAFSTARLQQPKPGIHAELFEESLNKLAVPPGAVVFVDPIALFLGGDLNHYVRVAIGCINLYRIVLRRQLCVVGIVHSSKQKADAKDRYVRLQDRISGSMAQLGYSATQMYLAGPEEMDADHHTFHLNPHHAPPQTWQLKQHPTTGLFAPFDTDHRQIDAAPDVLDPDLHAVLALLPLTPNTIVFPRLLEFFKDIQMTPRTLNRRLRELREMQLAVSPKRGHWARAIG